jgi:hypothetical protein
MGKSMIVLEESRTGCIYTLASDYSYDDEEGALMLEEEKER